MKPARIPISTYRVQFNKDFRFLDCRDIVPYLHMLGIGALYSSPRFRARRGSEHGYDVASPLRVNSELGTDEEFDDLCSKLGNYGMGLVLDIVPNHMAASHENPWWMDVLENGPSSPYAHYFDIDWRPVVSRASFLQEGKVLLPVLGDLYGNILERRELSLGLDETGFFLRYYERRFPLDPASYGVVLDVCLDRMARDLGREHDAIAEMEGVRQHAGVIPAGTATEPELIARRLDEGRVVKKRVFELYRDSPESGKAIDAALGELRESPSALHSLLEKQAYRLAYWKTAFEEINYRRFFDINDLVSLRVEEEDVFAARHQIIFQLIAEGKVTGLRVDHVDGLHDPETYLDRLQAAAVGATDGERVYTVVEKILGRDEPLPGTWKTCGTTGYDFLNALNGLYLDGAGLPAIEAIYARFTGKTESFAEVCYARNKQVMRELFAAELQVLGRGLGRLSARDWQARDVAVPELIAALVEVTARLPIYRTYVRDFSLSQRDRGYLKRTLDLARRRTSSTEIGDPAFDFLRRVLFLEPSSSDPELGAEYLRFVMRWQQFTGPVMAKGLEDTAGYVHNSLISMNEVGNDSVREEPPLDVAGFHRYQSERSKRWPHTMNTTSTHDTKRSEDVRARINVLSEIPREWEKRLLRWRKLNQQHKTEVNGIAVPTPGEEALLYQTLLGAWPFEHAEEAFLERVQEFLKKAVREAKVHSGWIRPDEAHEAALCGFAKAIFRTQPDSFRQDFLNFERRIAWHGALNSLAQLLIKITAPGVPDFYQGCELWDLSLVDPDNRRPVDFGRRIQLLEELRRIHSEKPRSLPKQILSTWQDGRIKLYLTDRALDFRRANAEVYREGEYVPLEAAGARQRNVCAFARHKDSRWCLTVTPRLTTQLGPVGRTPLGMSAWQDTAIQIPDAGPAIWQNVLTGERIEARPAAGGQAALAIAEVLRRFPVALLSASV